MSPTDRPPNTLIAAMLVPFGIALAVLVYETLAGPTYYFFYEFSFIGPILLVILPIALAQGRLDGRGIGAHARRLAAVSPCLLAPLSVLYPWVAAPGMGGSASGGFAYFLAWLTKYPNWGPINYEVLLGILCVLGASSIPVAFAMVRFLARPPRTRVLIILLALDLVAFIPLMIYLDIYSILAATGVRLDTIYLTTPDLITFEDWRQHGIFMVSDPSWIDFLLFGFGPLLRTVPVFVMTALVVFPLLRRAPAAPPPAGDVPGPAA